MGAVSGFEALPLREKVRLVQSHPGLLGDPVLQEQFRVLQATLEANPLLAFEPHSPAQREFIEARTPIVAAFAGNQFGKTTILVVCVLRELLSRESLPPFLRGSKRYDPPADAWILCPTEDKIFEAGGLQSAFEEWCPRSAFRGGAWGKAFNGARMTLSFANGSSLAFKTYKQDPSTLGGARLHVVGYDEPPPKKHREEARTRLVRHGGHELFAMTPLDANTGYVRREIFKRRESAHVTVVRGSIHDNPTLDAATVRLMLGDLSDLWRRAREFGDFVDVGGQIYPDFQRCVVAPFDLDFIRGLDVVVGIDPGIRNAGFVWVGFDRDLQAFVFNEGLLQGKEAHEYAEFIHAENKRLGLRDVQYVCDPAQRERGKVDSTTVKSALAQHGVYANDGQNSHAAGFDQLRSRMAHGRFFVSRLCVGLQDEADEYVAREPGEDQDDSHMEPVANRFHRLDALRYAVMERFWDPLMEEDAPSRMLGFGFDEDGLAVGSDPFGDGPAVQLPLGSMM